VRLQYMSVQIHCFSHPCLGVGLSSLGLRLPGFGFCLECSPASRCPIEQTLSRSAISVVSVVSSRVPPTPKRRRFPLGLISDGVSVSVSVGVDDALTERQPSLC
jgi:hypothetical protein